MDLFALIVLDAFQGKSEVHLNAFTMNNEPIFDKKEA